MQFAVQTACPFFMVHVAEILDALAGMMLWLFSVPGCQSLPVVLVRTHSLICPESSMAKRLIRDASFGRFSSIKNAHRNSKALRLTEFWYTAAASGVPFLARPIGVFEGVQVC